ncbi:D-alanyl-lipoteichoic acid biosynthesis protein DltD [Bacillus swezeyi]|uniref:Protein DltD n=1 Tax=Bacillus swezeyi TaxID=1925020 RepID=A0A1R1S1N2_9BACI|nr:D-alanyl-lipoteichoic acid biosynthesis protein DltD [Bacillus swezeyi]MEC1259133.1 D-alanyl-lipoteichoic acid biosynthesis protein DltD [Bacillus swezeyi]MED2927906.1 D-alanyl-lipoteichoic acid biosynthesis protein DltD [Bacillus swezeyi]MED2965182.1 D-alanyl-lipoteichoic acid biosynthesis protein DltD [Bacillus swezeyi]MED2977712.1 D-alanyl-lipoteichoic acid biosynthesis protein DltD [Bacillus swezeyi]MED3071443.1 D-alanyl-lipoteichoic acid biosynthesis protein DltD [Bacillus swezeyi]
MKKRFLFGPIILAFLLFFTMILIPNSWLAPLVPKDRVATSATELNPMMFQGTYLQGKMLEDPKYLPIYGSSELSRLDKFHPSNYFKVNKQGFTPYLVGKGGSQSLIHTINFAAHANQLKGKKMVFIISPQWFQKKGSDESHFAPNFSALQAYDLLFNQDIDSGLKKKIIKRMLKYDAVKNDALLASLFRAELNQDRLTLSLLTPAAKGYKSILEKKDIYYSMVEGKGPKRTISESVKNKSWDELIHMAEKLGEKESRNNKFKMTNGVFKKMKPKLAKLKGHNKKMNYAKSVEFGDFQMMLDVLKESGADPLFISVPVHGKFYDYTGFPKKGRTDYYAKIKKQIEAEGFQVADLTDHEYDPYFLKDSLHLGWKGWVYVDKEIKTYYHKKS